MRSAQDGHAADVEEVLHRADVARQIDAVQLDADRGLKAGFDVGEAEAANEEGAGEGIGADRGQDHVRNLAVQAGQALDLAVGQGFGAEGADGQRHVLKLLFTALGGDDDVADGGGFDLGCSGIRCCVLSDRGGGAGGGQGHAAFQPV
ncbi:hypothetical protein D3C87_1284970 [compost metagenome]